jgi:hypothetical protein
VEMILWLMPTADNESVIVRLWWGGSSHHRQRMVNVPVPARGRDVITGSGW